MAVKAIIDKLEDAPEALREHYQAGTAAAGTEGKFVLAVAAVNGWALEDVAGLKTALGKERTDRQTAQSALEKFKDKDGKPLDPAAAVAAIEENVTLKALDPTKEADKIATTKIEAAKAQLIQAHQTELSQREDRIKLLGGTVNSLLIDAAATAALAEAKGSVELLLPHVRAHTRVKEADGKFIVEVVDKDGNVRIANGKGDAMSIADLVAEMRGSDTFGRAFEGEGQSGTGKKPDAEGGGGGPKNPDMGGTREERAAAIAKKFKLPTS